MILNITTATLVQTLYLSLSGNLTRSGYLEYRGRHIRVSQNSAVLRTTNLVKICFNLNFFVDYPLFTLSKRNSTSESVYSVDGCIDPCYDIYLECNRFPFRLDNGSNLRVYFKSNWTSVCFPIPLTTAQASQFCREFRLPSSNAQTMVGQRMEGEDYWMIDDSCPNITTSGCSTIRRLRDSTCTPDTIAAIKCSFANLDFRLVDWDVSNYRGTLEIKIENSWNQICADQFTLNDAKVACRTLNQPSSDAKYIKKVLGSSAVARCPGNFRCSGSEGALMDCPGLQSAYTICHLDYVVELSCLAAQEGKLRLAGGYDGISGRLEIYRNNAWGTVCNNSFGDREISTACAQITNGKTKKGSAVPPLNVLPITNVSDVLLAQVRCGANQDRLDQCEHQRLGLLRCRHNNIVYMSCYEEPQFRLAGKDDTYGRLEVFHDGQWGTICNTDFDERQAGRVCEAMGLESTLATITKSLSLPGSGRIWLDKLSCGSNTDDMTDCLHSEWGQVDTACSHQQDLQLSCQVPVKHRSQFRLDMGDAGSVTFTYQSDSPYTYVSGGICMQTPSQEVADVACATLGRTRNRAFLLPETVSPRWSSETKMNDVSCTGRESHLFDCSFSTLMDSRACPTSNILAVACGASPEPDFSLRLEWGRYGRLDVLMHGVWGNICDQGFTKKSAEVACRKLGLPTSEPSVISTSDSETGAVWLTDVTCEGWESSLEQCSSSINTLSCWNTGKAVSIKCGTNERPIPTKPIIGGVLASLLVLAGIIALTWYLVRRYRRSTRPTRSTRSPDIPIGMMARYAEFEDPPLPSSTPTILPSAPPVIEDAVPSLQVDEVSNPYSNPPAYDDCMNAPPGYDELYCGGPKQTSS